MPESSDLVREEIAGLIPRSDNYAWKLYESDPLRSRYIHQAIKELQLPWGSSGLDAGCGIGLQALNLAQEVGPDGRIVGLDVSASFLDYARGIAENAGLAEQIDFVRGDIKNLPFEDDSFDWIWSANCAGYPSRKPLPLVKEMARVVKPGGKVAILVWTSQQLLPGYPLLEAKLNATSSGIAPFTSDMSPQTHWMRALGWFRDAGLEDLQARTFVGDMQAPLSDEQRKALISLMEMRWPHAQAEISKEDWELYRRLSRPESDDFILDVPGYYAFYTETLFSARVAP